MGNKVCTGECKWFSNAKAYGFLVEDGKPEVEYFVHYSSIKMDGFKTLKAGQKVSFVLKKTEKGMQATEVTVIG